MLTSQLGTSDSELGNVLFGVGSTATIYTASISDSISLSDTLIGQTLTGVMSDTLTFTDTFIGFKNFIADILSFADSVVENGVLNLSLSDTLTFSESILHTIFESVSDTLVFSDTATGFAEKVGVFTDIVTITESLLQTMARGVIAGDLLEFAEQMKRNFTLLRTFNETLTFVDVLNGVAARVLGDTCTFSDAISGFISKLMQDQLEFGELLTANHNTNRSLTDQLIVFDSLLISIYTRQTLSDTVILIDTMTGASTRPVFDTLAFSDTVSGVASKPISDTLTFVDTLTFTRVINKTLSDILTFTDTASMSKILTLQLTEAIIFTELWQSIRARFGSMSDSLDLTDEQLREVIPRTIEDELILTDEILNQKIGGRESTDTLSLADTLDVRTVLTRTINDSVLFLDAFVVKVIRSTTPTPIITDPIHQVNPPPGLVNPPSPVWEAVIDVEPQLIMTGRTRSIVLPPPEFNDFEANQGKIVVQRSMTGRFRVYSKRTDREKLNWRFILPKYKADELREFMLAEIDTLLNVITWDGDYWQLQILSDSADFTESGRWAPCGNKVEVTIELVGNRYA